MAPVSQVERIYMLWLVLLEWKELFKFAIHGMLWLTLWPLFLRGVVVWRLLDISEFWLLRKTDKHLLLVQNCSLLR